MQKIKIKFRFGTPLDDYHVLGGVIELFIFNPDTREYGRKIAATRGLDKFLYDNMYSQPWDVSNSHPCYSLMVFITDIHR